MSKSDEMFEKLGYTDIEKFRNGIHYYKGDEEIGFVDYGENGGKIIEIDKFAGHITIQELKAINEKVKELGWI